MYSEAEKGNKIIFHTESRSYSTYAIVNIIGLLKNLVKNQKLPNKYDVKGGANGLARVWSQYR